MDQTETTIPHPDPADQARPGQDDLLAGGSGEAGTPDPEHVLPDLLDGGSGRTETVEHDAQDRPEEDSSNR